jgi:hypothetical protein
MDSSAKNMTPQIKLFMTVSSVILVLGVLVLSSCTTPQEAQESLPVVCNHVDERRLKLDKQHIILDGLVVGELTSAKEQQLREEVDRKGLSTKIAISSGYKSYNNFEAARLGAERVLLIGGLFTLRDNSTRRLANTWICDLTKGTFVSGPTMHYARFGHRCCTIHDGSILITGGVPQVERFYPLSNRIKVVGTLVDQRTDHAIVEIGNQRVLLAGGVNYADRTCGPEGEISSLEIFDLGTGMSHIPGRMNERRILPDCLKLNDGSVLILGGSKVTYPQSEPHQLKTGELLNLNGEAGQN